MNDDGRTEHLAGSPDKLLMIQILDEVNTLLFALAGTLLTATSSAPYYSDLLGADLRVHGTQYSAKAPSG